LMRSVQPLLCSPTFRVSDGRQPPLTFDLSLRETAGSCSLPRRVGRFVELQMPL
jgi:hypothetical protein